MRQIDNYIEVSKARFLIEKTDEWRKWITEIPFIQFPADYQVQVIPPFQGAIVRFRVKKEGSDKSISVYLDCYEALGCYDGPYWEMYPYEDDTARFNMEDTKGLLKSIAEEFDRK